MGSYKGALSGLEFPDVPEVGVGRVGRKDERRGRRLGRGTDDVGTSGQFRVQSPTCRNGEKVGFTRKRHR